jgi:hypothetical protein
MLYCKFCGTALPLHARFCGRCGLPVSTAKAAEPRSGMLPTINTSAPTKFSVSSYQPLQPIQSNDDGNQNGRSTNLEERRESLEGLPWLDALALEQRPPPESIPMVHGTPQVNGISKVEGTPNPQHLHTPPTHLHHQVSQGSRPQNSSPHTSAQIQQHASHGFRPQSGNPQQIYASPVHLHHQATPSFRPQSSMLRGIQPQPNVRLNLQQRRASRYVKGRWMTVAVASVVVVASVISALALLLPANLTLSGGTIVSRGGTLHLHGEGFMPGSRVRLMLDNRIPLFFAVQPNVIPQGMNAGGTEAGETDAYTAGDAAFVNVVLAQLMGEESKTYLSSGMSQDIQVGVSGNFDVTVAVSSSWSAGRHSIRAIESVSSIDVQSVGLTFQIEPTAAKLVVAPLGLDFGLLKMGRKASRTVTVRNVGEQPLQWAANVGTVRWLTLTTSSGIVQPGSSQTIQLTANTAQLSPGHYTATLAITAGNQSQQVAVTLGVAALPNPTPAPQHCPSGLVGTPPNCYQPAPQHCPSGLVGTPPNCYQPAPQHCPSGLVGTPPHCYQPAPQHCPSGLVGTPPHCYQPAPPQCPSGLVGTPPNCYQPAPPQCPSGLVGTPPNCHHRHCPSGEVGTPPNCQPGSEDNCPPFCQPQPQTCPSNTVFENGQCVPVGVHCEPPYQPVPYPPYCVPPQCDPTFHTCSQQGQCNVLDPNCISGDVELPQLPRREPLQSACEPPDQFVPYPPYCESLPSWW